MMTKKVTGYGYVLPHYVVNKDEYMSLT